MRSYHIKKEKKSQQHYSPMVIHKSRGGTMEGVVGSWALHDQDAIDIHYSLSNVQSLWVAQAVHILCIMYIWVSFPLCLCSILPAPYFAPSLTYSSLFKEVSLIGITFAAVIGSIGSSLNLMVRGQTTRGFLKHRVNFGYN